MQSISFIIVLLLLSLTSLRAQEREPLSLSDAIQVGLSENFGIRIEQQNVAVARVNNTWGAAGRWPTINLSVSQNNNFRNVDNPASFLQGLTISNDVTPFVGVSWILFDGFRVVANRERLQALERLSEGNAQVVIENAVQGIITQYYLVQLEQQRLEVLEQSIPTIKGPLCLRRVAKRTGQCGYLRMCCKSKMPSSLTHRTT